MCLVVLCYLDVGQHTVGLLVYVHKWILSSRIVALGGPSFSGKMLTCDVSVEVGRGSWSFFYGNMHEK